jgi:hypothetical protein
MSHPGYDDSNTTTPGEPAAPTYPAAADNIPKQPLPAQPTSAMAAVSQPVPVPGYPQTAGFAPVPAPPTYDPAAVAQQYSAPPTSGPYGYGMPMMSAIPAPPQPKRGRVGVIILSILTTLFLLAAGMLGTLFVLKNKEADKLNGQVTQLTSDVSAAKSKADALQKDLDNTKRDLTDAKGQTDEVTAQKKAVADCINALYAYFDGLTAANGVRTAAVKTLATDFEAKCKEADKYL